MHERRADAHTDAALLLAPLDRLLFYPAAHGLYRLIHRWPVTPNQVSVLHLVLGLSTFWWMAKPSGSEPVIAVVVFFARNVLDCLDGVIARAKHLTSPMGKVLDEWADAASATALMAGIGLAAWRETPGWWVPALTALAMAGSAVLALQSEFGRRRIAHALATGEDCVAPDYEAAKQRRTSSVGGWLGYLADTWKLWLNGSNGQRDRLAAEARFFHDHAGSPRQRWVLRLVGLGAGDNPVLILLIFVLAGQAAAGFAAALTYSVVLSLANLRLTNRYLAQAR